MKIIISGIVNNKEFGIYDDAAISVIKASQEVRADVGGWTAIRESGEITVSNSSMEINGEIPFISFKEKDIEEIIVGDKEVSSLKEAYELLQ